MTVIIFFFFSISTKSEGIENFLLYKYFEKGIF